MRGSGGGKIEVGEELGGESVLGEVGTVVRGVGTVVRGVGTVVGEDGVVEPEERGTNPYDVFRL